MDIAFFYIFQGNIGNKIRSNDIAWSDGQTQRNKIAHGGKFDLGGFKSQGYPWMFGGVNQLVMKQNIYPWYDIEDYTIDGTLVIRKVFYSPSIYTNMSKNANKKYDVAKTYKNINSISFLFMYFIILRMIPRIISIFRYLK